MMASTLNQAATENRPAARTASFEQLREQDQIYIDKTALLYELLRSGGKLLLIRPGRFGKTLLLSTLESLIRHGLRHFKGLAIERLWKGVPAHTVIRLDFSRITGFRNADEFSEAFDSYLGEVLVQERLVPELPASGMGLRTFARCLRSLPVASTAVLIDDYDAPLTECLDRPELFEDVQRVLSRFYAILKGSDDAVRFLFITGTTRFSQADIFSGLNDLTDISLWPEFGTLLGYTEEEILRHFPAQLSRAADRLGLDAASLIREMHKHYGGYCFDAKNSTHVFAPCSVQNFLRQPELGFKNYWLESVGQTPLLKKYLGSHELETLSRAEDENCVNLDRLAWGSGLDDDRILLFHAGALTIKRVDEGDAFLGCPNLEVKDSMDRLFAKEPPKGDVSSEAGAA